MQGRRSGSGCFLGMLAGLSIAGSAMAECSDGDLTKPPQFSVKGAEAYDAKTNLTWQRCAVGQRWEQSAGCLGSPAKFTFDEAQALAQGGWRVPTIDELTTIVSPLCNDPAIDPLVFPNTLPEQFWSSVLYHPMAFYVSFRNGSSNPTYYTDSRYSVRLVRSGQPDPAR